MSKVAGYVTERTRIVRAEPAHAPACAAIVDAWIDENDWMPRLHDAASIERHVREVVFAMRRVWVALNGSRVIGFLAVTIENELTSLYVAANARGRGVGHALLDRAKTEHPGGLTLWVFEANERARAFYDRQGFVPTGRTDYDNEEGIADVSLRWERP